MRLTETFEVAAPVERAWRLLNDVPTVVPCMPGAELVETLDEHSWKALVHVTLGPMGLQFTTDVTRETIDEAARRVVLTAHARELRGRGGAQATIDSTLSDAAVGTRVDIVTDLSLQGPVAQFGRGIVPDVASQLTRQFAANIAALLEPGGDGEPEAERGAAGHVEPAASPGPAGHAPKVPTEVAPISALRLTLRALWQAARRLVPRR